MNIKKSLTAHLKAAHPRLRGVVQHDDHKSNDDQKIIALRHEGDRARDRREWVAAIRFYKQYLDTFSEDFDIWVQLGHSYKESGNLASAESAYLSALNLKKEDADLLLNLGHLKKLQGDQKAAINFYNQSFEIDQNKHAAHELSLAGEPVGSKRFGMTADALFTLATGAGGGAPQSFLYLRGVDSNLYEIRSDAGDVANLVLAVVSSIDHWHLLDELTSNLELENYNIIVLCSASDCYVKLRGNLSKCAKFVLIDVDQDQQLSRLFLALLDRSCLTEYETICFADFSLHQSGQPLSIPLGSLHKTGTGAVSTQVSIEQAAGERATLLKTVMPRAGWMLNHYNFATPLGAITLFQDIILRDINGLRLTPKDLIGEDGKRPMLRSLNWLIGAIAFRANLSVSTVDGFAVASSPNRLAPPRIERERQIKAIAFYLPQFHPIPENDKWWGKGFTEWANVVKGRPSFRGHHQPRVPGDLGYYDLRVADIPDQQAQLALENSVYGFCYYYYWFQGKKLLNAPIENMLARKKPVHPFCVCWANENWSRNWDGQNRQVLIQQNYSLESNRQFIHEIIPMMRDPRYIRHHGKPVLIVYRIKIIPDWLTTAEMWREECRRAGIGEIHLCAVRFGLEPLEGQPSDNGVDAFVLFPPHELVRNDVRSQLLDVSSDFSGELVSYDDALEGDIQRFHYGYPWPVHRGVMMSWDNSARRDRSARVFVGATPARFRYWLNAVIRQDQDYNPDPEALLFINAWNEWAEGTVLEPDKRFADGYLRVVRHELKRYFTPFVKTEEGKSFAMSLAGRGEKVTEAGSGVIEPVSSYSKKLQTVRFDGRLSKKEGRPTLLVCGHVAGHQLFGGERSFLDVVQTLSGMDVNVVTALPSANNADYIDRLRNVSFAVYALPYKQWIADRVPDEYFISSFMDIIAAENVTVLYANTIVHLEALIAAERMQRTRVVHVRELITLDHYLAERIGKPPQEIIETVFRRSDHIIANSDASYRLFHRAGRTFRVPNAVDVDELNLDLDLTPGKPIRFGIVSSNIPTKGLSDFLEVARQCQDRGVAAQFVVVGPQNSHTKDYQRAGAVPGNVQLLGYRESSKSAMMELDVLVSTSLFAESFGRTVAEAMACRRPVIGYEWGALPELVEHGETGFLATYRDTKGVADFVAKLASDPDRILEMGLKGRKRVESMFSYGNLRENLGAAVPCIVGSEGARPNDLSGWKDRHSEAPGLSVIVPVYNAPDEVRSCLDAIVAYTDLSAVRVIVMNDASPDEKIRPLLDSYAEAHGIVVIHNKKNLGYTHNVNLGIENAGADDVILLNSDAFVTPNWIAGLRGHAYSANNIGTVTAMSDNAGAFSFPAPNVKNIVPDYMSNEEFAMRIVQLTGSCRPIDVPTGSGFCLFIRRKLLNEIGLFDAETYPRGYGEENDFCQRAVAAGWRNVISPSCYVFHKRSASLAGEKAVLMERNLANLMKKYPHYSGQVREAFASKEMRSLYAAAQLVYG